MLSEFVTANRLEIIARCRARVAARMAPRATELELEHGIPLFLDDLAATLKSKLLSGLGAGDNATKHGRALLSQGFTVAQVVHDYGDVCQTITEMSIEREAPITTEEFRALNLCLDDAIAGAVTEYGRQREVNIVAEDNQRATEDLGFLGHELRNLLGTATLAFEALRSGSVGISGSTGAMLGRSLMSLRELVDRSLAVVRLKAGIMSREPIVVAELVEEIEVSAMMEAKARGHQLTIEMKDPKAVVEADRQILASIISNLVQNAYKYTHPHGHVVLRTSATADRVSIEIQDQCGGLPPGTAEAMFKPFEQRSKDRSGLGLGLAICLRGVNAIGGTIRVRDLPREGCVFTVELPRAS
jgi:signal transduction histidine kinase